MQACNIRDKKGLISFYAGIVLGIVLIAGIFLTGLASVTRTIDIMDLYDRDLLRLLADGGEEEIKVVLLGNSRLRYGFDLGIEPGQPIALPNGGKIRAVQFAKDVAMFSQYEYLWPAIIKSRPDYVVIQDMVLTTRRSKNKAPVSLNGVSQVIYRYLEEELLGRSPREQWTKDRTERKCRPREFRLSEVQESLKYMTHRDSHALEGNKSLESAREGISQALAAGIKVIILKLPSNREVIDRYHVPQHLIDYHGMGFIPTKEQLLPGAHEKVIWLEYPPLAAEAYCDLVHVNDKGREALTSWLTEQFL